MKKRYFANHFHFRFPIIHLGWHLPVNTSRTRSRTWFFQTRKCGGSALASKQVYGHGKEKTNTRRGTPSKRPRNLMGSWFGVLSLQLDRQGETPCTKLRIFPLKKSKNQSNQKSLLKRRHCFGHNQFRLGVNLSYDFALDG